MAAAALVVVAIVTAGDDGGPRIPGPAVASAADWVAPSVLVELLTHAGADAPASAGDSSPLQGAVSSGRSSRPARRCRVAQSPTHWVRLGVAGHTKVLDRQRALDCQRALDRQRVPDRQRALGRRTRPHFSFLLLPITDPGAGQSRPFSSLIRNTPSTNPRLIGVVHDAVCPVRRGAACCASKSALWATRTFPGARVVTGERSIRIVHGPRLGERRRDSPRRGATRLNRRIHAIRRPDGANRIPRATDLSAAGWRPYAAIPNPLRRSNGGNG